MMPLKSERYIGVNAFIGVLKEMQNDFCECPRAFGKTAACVLEEAINKLQSFPTANVAPVIHAHWIKCEESVTNRNGNGLVKIREYYSCSRCCRIEDEREPFCNCGAKMDEGTEG